jgi:hypothetical protein
METRDGLAMDGNASSYTHNEILLEAALSAKNCTVGSAKWDPQWDSQWDPQ